MIPQFNAIVLDVIVIVMLLSIVALGAFKGIKHISIDFTLLAGSIALSFSSLTKPLKSYIIELLAPNIKLGAGISNEVKLGVNFLYLAMASLVLTVLVYILLRLIKYLVFMLLKKNMIKRNQLPKYPDVVSRILGGVFSLIFNGALFIVLLSGFANPFVGGDKTVNSSFVTKYVIQVEDVVIKDLIKDPLAETKLVLKVVKGDLFAEISDKDAQNFIGLSTLVSEGKLVPDSLENVQDVLDGMYNLLSLVSSHALDEEGIEVDGFEKAVELTRNLVTDSINAMNSLNTSGEKITAKNTLAISNLLKKVVKNEIVDIFESVFVIN